MQRLTSSCCTRLSSFCCTRLSSSQCKLLLCLFLPPSCTEWSGPAQVEEINDQRWSSQLNWYLLQSLATCLWSTEATSLSVTWICNEPWEWGRWGSSCSSQKTSEDQCVLLRAHFGRCSDLTTFGTDIREDFISRTTSELLRKKNQLLESLNLWNWSLEKDLIPFVSSGI